jgi:hypothetical protein
LRTDPLFEGWRDLPSIEFVEPSEPPDHWFLPRERGRLNLALTTRRPINIEVVVNLTPTETSTRPFGIQDRNLSILLPSLKLISELNGANVSTNVALLDLARRHIVFEQAGCRDLAWPKMKSSLSDASSGRIDVKSLADRQHSAAFFVSEVGKRYARDESLPGGSRPGRAVIVLSGPMAFDAEQDLRGTELTPSSDSRIFYIRLQNSPNQRVPLSPQPRRRRSFGGYGQKSGLPQINEALNAIQTDRLAATLTPLEPQLFDVTSADQFRKALATIMSKISTM